MTNEQQERFMRKPEVCNIFGYCNTTLYNRIQDGLFPTHISLGGRTVGFIASEVNIVQKALISGVSKHHLKSIVSQLIAERKEIKW
jgi:prophage regulatory protein